METTIKTSVPQEVINDFKKIVGEENVLLDRETKSDYGSDKTEDYHFMPDVVVKPATTQEVSELLKICNKFK